MKKFAIISLGCPRNLVDSEVMAGHLKASGLKMSPLEDGVDVVVVNTCAFVESAREESIEAIIEAGDLKKKGKAKYLVISGCLGQMYKNKLADKLPEADLIIGTSDFPRISGLLMEIKKRKNRSAISSHLSYLYNENSPRLPFTPKHYAYIKISEGCSNCCSYCVISRLRGDFRSRLLGSVVAEVRDLARWNTLKEIELIGQDTTLFGADRHGRRELPRLLRELSKLENSIKWIRLLYTHPAHYTDELIDVIGSEGKICKYLDLPIQHISDKVLRLMNRKTTKKEITKLIHILRKKIPGLVLRTSIITGFPGETDKDFKELLKFLADIKFDALGAFIYSREEGTRASRLKDQVSEGLKQERYDQVMKLQQAISIGSKRKFLGKIVDVLIDEKASGEDNKVSNSFIGRTQGDAPEIDGVVYLTGKGVKVGDFCKVRITDTLEYDLIGEKA
ncbi:MAG: 30S ribosomal protein S12 methylthiotransferase RimO [Candidatus Omnitrophica bacterium]|nr:30S ribosomal protein S12 methylthiotransferase RimO [Candidatus Omnitrophota bacterium]